MTKPEKARKPAKSKCYRVKCPTPKACADGCVSYERDDAKARALDRRGEKIAAIRAEESKAP